ncbi:hypothetical protein [Sphingobium nicotianae]|uniref:Uncharacterized protein n=1 Tax=Sphingobium nicotianae TaxID=2782607 RepID=A0A9X1ISG6_9SPHN|nr:hypothetical protein [Sphingobium nicotianae]MBT2188382.1 hypothetical protein [Sphingobium nicotianae]
MSSLPTMRIASPQQCPPMPEELVVRALIADELDRIRETLEEMGVQLCCDPEIVRSHFGALQTIDELCQRNENLARTLRAGDMAQETALITLESLRTRMQSALAERRPYNDAASIGMRASR